MAAYDKSDLNSYNTDTAYTENSFLSNGNNPSPVYMNKGIINSSTNTSEIDDQIVIQACMAGNVDIIKKFLDLGHDVNEFLISGWNLLLHAASYAQPHAVEFLLNSGANPNSHYEGYTPVIALCDSFKGSPEDRIECLRYLIEAGANTNASNKINETPLMLACKTQEIDFISELLKYTDHINYADGDQKTALFYAVLANRYNVVELLINEGADKGWMSYRGDTPYNIAITKGFDELLPLLYFEIDEDKQDIIETNKASTWLSLFPVDNGITSDAIDDDILSILYGMGLESYKACFRGISLKRFLQLKEDDLERLGIDISVHREKFITELFKFHKREWSSNLLNIDKSKPFSAFKTLNVLGNINRQLSIMSSGVYFSQNYLESLENEESNLNEEEKEILRNELETIETMALKMKEATERINALSQIINEENSELSLPTYIGKKKKNNQKWILLTIVTLVSIYLVKRRWSNQNSIKKWRNIFNFSLCNTVYNKFCMIGLLFKGY